MESILVQEQKIENTTCGKLYSLNISLSVSIKCNALAVAVLTQILHLAL